MSSAAVSERFDLAVEPAVPGLAVSPPFDIEVIEDVPAPTEPVRLSTENAVIEVHPDRIVIDSELPVYNNGNGSGTGSTT